MAARWTEEPAEIEEKTRRVDEVEDECRPLLAALRRLRNEFHFLELRFGNDR